MDAADPRYIKLELDIAHYQQGGGDPVRAYEKYTIDSSFFTSRTLRVFRVSMPEVALTGLLNWAGDA
jgi:hypothetical protein